MIPPEIPDNERQRQEAVERYQLLDTLPESSYDSITDLIAYICDTPISLITLLDHDRNFLKSHHGVPFDESPRNISFCGHAINSEEEITIVEDSRKDERFVGNPLVTEHEAIFYAGVPLVDPNGFKLGTLCVYDNRPRKLTPEQRKALITMARQVMNLMEARYQNIKLRELQEKLKLRNRDLEKFAHKVSHDLKSPLANIISLTQLLEQDYTVGDENSKQYFQYLRKSSRTLKDYIEGLLSFYKSDDLIGKEPEPLDMEELKMELLNLYDLDHEVEIGFDSSIDKIKVNKAALMQILMNLVANALKYNSKKVRKVNVSAKEEDNRYVFEVADNGDGIPDIHLDKIFELFTIVGVSDRNGNMGSGIGLATVKNLVNQLGGKISVSSKKDEGSMFRFTIGK
jgi:signal transduction histidine kinase